MKNLLLLLIIPTLLFSFHDHDEKETNHTHDHEKDFVDRSLDAAEDGFAYLYKKINLSSKYIDEFLTQEKDEKKYLKSYLRIESSINKTESQSLDSNIDVDLKIHLPKLKKKFTLTLDNKEQKRDEEFEDSSENVPFQENDYNLGLAYQTLKKDYNLKAKVGVRFGSSTYPFVKSSISKKYEPSTNGRLKLEQELRYSEQLDLESTSTFQYDYLLKGKDLVLSNHNEFYINTDEDINNIYNSIRLYQHIKGKNYLNYVLAMSINDNDSNLKPKNYRAYVSYRHYVRKWLYWDIVPATTLDAIEDHHTLSLEFKLGFLIAK